MTFFNCFLGHFLPPGSGSGYRDPIESGSDSDTDPDLDPQHFATDLHPVPELCCLLFHLKVHKREKFFSSDFEFFTILYLVKLKY